jgi:hypothetical protein
MSHDRYARQMILPQVGALGQARLQAAHAVVVGAGGLGSTAIPALAGAGVGRLTLVDADMVEASNLHRQPLYTMQDLGQAKAQVAAARAQAINPDCQVQARISRAGPQDAALISGWRNTARSWLMTAASISPAGTRPTGQEPAPCFSTVWLGEGRTVRARGDLAAHHGGAGSRQGARDAAWQPQWGGSPQTRGQGRCGPQAGGQRGCGKVCGRPAGGRKRHPSAGGRITAHHCRGAECTRDADAPGWAVAGVERAEPVD